MYFDRFDIIEAHYWFCAHYHGGQYHWAHDEDGQWCHLYHRLCRINEYFTPSPLSNGPESENAKAIYAGLVDAYGKEEL